MRIAFLIAVIALLFGCASQPINEGIGKDGRAYRGAGSPKVTIVEYSDFECQFCGRAQPTLEQVLRSYPDARLVFRHLPLPIHPGAFPSAVAAACAEKQGKFWKMHDLLYAHQDALNASDLEGYAGKIGLDMAAYRKCVESGEGDAVVREDMAAGIASGVASTPTFIIGQGRVEGAQPFDSFSKVIGSELAK